MFGRIMKTHVGMILQPLLSRRVGVNIKVVEYHAEPFAFILAYDHVHEFEECV